MEMAVACFKGHVCSHRKTILNCQEGDRISGPFGQYFRVKEQPGQ
jgi:hypothetical protein